MIDIYDEEGYIQEVLQNGFSQKWQRDAALLVKYFKTEYALGNQPSWNKAWVKETIKEKCKKYVPTYDPNVTFNRVNKLVDTTWKNWKVDPDNPKESSQLRKIKEIKIPEAVLNWFLNLDTYYITDEEVKDIKSRRKNVSVKNHPITMARAKYLFTLYVWTKIQENYLSRPNIHYLEKYNKKLRNDADLKPSFSLTKERNVLFDLGFIDINHGLGVTPIFMDKEDFKEAEKDEKVILLGRNDLYLCGKWLEMRKFGTFKCQKCRKILPHYGNGKNENKRKYCKECAKAMIDGITFDIKSTKITTTCDGCGKEIDLVSKYSSKRHYCWECRAKLHAKAQERYAKKMKTDLPSRFQRHQFFLYKIRQKRQLFKKIMSAQVEGRIETLLPNLKIKRID